MGLPLIFILGHSFIRRFDNFVAANPNLNHQFLLNNVATLKWRGVGAELQYDLPVVASSAPDIVILQLGTNDLSRLDLLAVASYIEELVTILHDTYKVKLICVWDPILYSTRVFARLANMLKRSSKPSLMSFLGDIGVFGMHPRDFSLVMVSTSIGRANISFFGVSEVPF